MQEGYLCFVHMLNKFNASTNLQINKQENLATSKMNIRKEMIFIGKAMAILTYDFLSLSAYNAIINKDSEFQFLKYIRNGAAHNNKFNLKDQDGNWKIGKGEIIEWNGMQVSRESQGNEVFNNFISIFDVFLLAKCFSERLTKIDCKK